MCIVAINKLIMSFLTRPKGLRDEKTITVDEIVDDENLQAQNNYVQVSGIARLDLSPGKIMQD